VAQNVWRDVGELDLLEHLRPVLGGAPEWGVILPARKDIVFDTVLLII
jgi:hypothetical protein